MLREKQVAVTDIDGVLADSAVPVINEVNNRYGTAFSPAEIDDWHWLSRAIEKLTGSREEGKRAEQLWFDPEVLAASPPVAGAQEGVRRLIDRGFEFFAATSRLPNARESTLDWVSKYFPEIGADRVYLRLPGNEEIISSAEIKLLAVGMLGAKLYVEDDAVAVEFVTENIGAGLVVAMLDCGWNQRANPNLNKYRTQGWKGVSEKVGDSR